MDRTGVQTSSAPQAIGPYSQAVRLGDLVFVSGQLPLDPATGALVSQDVGEQTTQVLANLRAILEAAGSSLDRVVKATIMLTDMADFDAVNKAYAQAFTGPVLPARATFGVAGLAKGASVEIDVIAG